MNHDWYNFNVPKKIKEQKKTAKLHSDALSIFLKNILYEKIQGYNTRMHVQYKRNSDVDGSIP